MRQEYDLFDERHSDRKRKMLMTHKRQAFSLLIRQHLLKQQA
jgi:hypothetical protein